MYVCMYVFMYVCMYVCIYVFMYVCMYAWDIGVFNFVMAVCAVRCPRADKRRLHIMN